MAMPPMVAPAEIVLAELGSSLTVVGGAVVAFERFFGPAGVFDRERGSSPGRRDRNPRTRPGDLPGRRRARASMTSERVVDGLAALTDHRAVAASIDELLPTSSR